MYKLSEEIGKKSIHYIPLTIIDIWIISTKLIKQYLQIFIYWNQIMVYNNSFIIILYD